MNKVNFLEKQDFPMDSDTLDFLQSIALMASEIAKIGGNNYILSGCEQNGSNVSGGYVVIDGELLPFKGGTKNDYIHIKEEVEQVENAGETYNAYQNRVVEFGNDGTGRKWSDFKRVSLPILQKAIDDINDNVSKTVKDINNKISTLESGLGTSSVTASALSASAWGRLNFLQPKVATLESGLGTSSTIASASSASAWGRVNFLQSLVQWHHVHTAFTSRNNALAGVMDLIYCVTGDVLFYHLRIRVDRDDIRVTRSPDDPNDVWLHYFSLRGVSSPSKSKEITIYSSFNTGPAGMSVETMQRAWCRHIVYPQSSEGIDLAFCLAPPGYGDRPNGARVSSVGGWSVTGAIDLI